MQDILYNPIEKKYKNPVGAVLQNEEISFTIGINKGFQIYNLALLVHKDYLDQESYYRLNYIENDELYNYYNVKIRIPEEGIYWYCFEFDDCYGKHYISYQESQEGILSNSKNYWQLSIHNKFLGELKWFKGKVMYQIMVDRFYNGGVDYKKDGIVFHENWNEIPNYLPVNGEILNNDFFGGDLLGVIEKLDYLKELNVSVILLNPIFLAYSNHKYDTADFSKIDPMFGDEEIFKRLCKEAKKRGISIILDGVFNHTGSDSVYFNKNNTFDTLGAYQSKESPYYKWYNFRKFPDDYECWWNFLTLPRVNQNDPKYLDFITGEKGIAKKWIKAGARGYRLDVVDEYTNNFIEKLSKAIKDKDEDNILIGEVWEDASNKIAYTERRKYFLGNQLDSVMNYPFRKAILDFVNNQDIYGFRNCIRSIINNYPKHVLDSLMNIIATHDTIRSLNAFLNIDYYYLSRKEQAEYRISNEEYYLVRQKLKLASAIQFTLPGVPCVFYGDEVGIQGFKDPFCRATMPWGNFDEELLSWYKTLGKIREDEVFIDGEYQEELCDNNVFAYSRNKNGNKVIVIINSGKYDYRYKFDGVLTNMITGKTLENYVDVYKKSLLILKLSQ